jgi:hypothetical protein
MQNLFNTLVTLVPLRHKFKVLFLQTQYIDLKKHARISFGNVLAVAC